MIDEAIDGEQAVVPSTNIATHRSRLTYTCARTATVVAIYVDVMKVAAQGGPRPTARPAPVAGQASPRS